jgi:carbamoyltransferase
MFKQTYVFPASGDDGASIGAAQYVQHQVLGLPPTGKPVPSMSLGPAYRGDTVVGALEANAHKVEFERVDAIEETVADALVAGKVVGWFRGRMEFGRARSATAASWPTRAPPRCARSSTSASSCARNSARSRRLRWSRRPTTISTCRA